MDGIKLNEEFGDLFAYNLNVNFQNRVTEIYYGEYIRESATPIKKMIFENVVWQEFSQFDFVNIFNIVEVGYSFEVFFNSHLSYFNTMKNYISEDNMEAMKLPNLFYYTFRQTCGFNCFVITKIAMRVEYL